MSNYRELIAEEQGVELWYDYDDMDYYDEDRLPCGCCSCCGCTCYDDEFEYEVEDKCKYCEDGAFNTLIKSEKIGSLIYFIALKSGGITYQDISDCEHDSSVVFEMRNGSGYIRLGDTDDMGCLDHSENFKINYCPMCGWKL